VANNYRIWFPLCILIAVCHVWCWINGQWKKPGIDQVCKNMLFDIFFHQINHFVTTVDEMRGDYKWCEWLNKFIGKKVIATQKLNAHHCKEQLKKFFSYPMQVQYVLHMLRCTHQDDIRLHAKHSAIKADQFLQSLFVFNPSSCSGL
jgi:hypothetical protein